MLHQDLGLVLNPKIKLPIDAFQACPERGCGNPKLKKRGIDVHCSLCGWDSGNAFVDAGGLDWWEGYTELHHSSIELSI